jgi:hypothetical protein
MTIEGDKFKINVVYSRFKNFGFNFFNLKNLKPKYIEPISSGIEGIGIDFDDI